MLGLGLAKIPLVDIAVRQLVLDEEVVVDFLRGEIKSPKVALELVGGTFFDTVNDAQVNVVRAWRGDAGEVEQAVGYRLVQPMLAAPAIIALLDAGAEV